jgi:AcrR family transcriptional regulator
MIRQERSSVRAEKSRRELTEIAINCFARYGFQGSSVDRIARMAGVTKGAIYYHFRDKEDLLAAAVRDRIGEFEARVQNACANLGPAESLRRIADVCIEHAESNDHPRFVMSIMIEAIDTNDEISSQLRDMMRRFRAFLRNLIKQGQATGAFRSDACPDEIAAAYTSSVLGAEAQFYQDPEAFVLRHTLKPAIERLMDYLQARPAQ